MAYDEKRALDEYAMRVFMDPSSSSLDREQAKQRLVGSDHEANYDVLSVPERREMLWAWEKVLDASNVNRSGKPLPPTAREQLDNAMELAQARWEQLAAECREQGLGPPSPIYSFRSVTIAPAEPRELEDAEPRS